MKEIAIKIAGECEEAVLACLFEKGISGVVHPPVANSENIIIAFYLDEKKWKLFKPELASKLLEMTNIFGVSAAKISERHLEEEVWKNSWKRYAKTIRIGEDLIIKPSWRALRKKPSCPVITIDPQMAFGTGGHPSTLLCLRHLISIKKEKQGSLGEVLDVGTGSGILSIAAAFSGARHVTAIDIDASALNVARENAEHNGVRKEILDFFSCPLSDLPGQFDLIFANITAQTLLDLLDALQAHLTPSGALIVSGILVEQGKAFLKKSKDCGLEKIGTRRSGEWISYRLGKKR